MGVKVLPLQCCLVAPTNFASTTHLDTHCDKIGYGGEAICEYSILSKNMAQNDSARIHEPRLLYSEFQTLSTKPPNVQGCSGGGGQGT